MDTKVNTEDFIWEVEKQPAIWDASSEAYSNKQVKLNAWNEIVCTFLPDFEQQSLAKPSVGGSGCAAWRPSVIGSV